MKPKAPYALCDQCPFQDRKFAASVGPVGNKSASLAIVSRSPGQYDAMNGKVFSGPTGKVLDHLLLKQGVSKKQVKLTNVVLCQSEGDEPGFGRATACCEPRLEAEIAQCDTVIAAGREAVYALTGESNIAANRGYVHYRESLAGRKQRVVITNNPAMVLRDDGAFPEMVRDFRLAINPIDQPTLPKVRWTEDIDEARSWIPQLLSSFKAGTLLASDIEGGYPNIACAGFSIRSERAVVFGEPIVRQILDELRPLWENTSVKYLWHNGKYDTKELRRFGIQARTDEDSMLLSYALDERPGNPELGAGGHSLEWLLKDVIGWPKYEPSSVREYKRLYRLQDWDKLNEWLAVKRNRIDLYEYNGLDTAGTLTLFEALKELAVLDDVWEKPYKSQLLPVLNALLEIELRGNIYDADAACDILEDEVWPTLYEWRDELRTISGIEKLNPNSPKQLGELLYDSWGITHQLSRPKIERKGKRSVDAKVREEILRGDFVSRTDREVIVPFVETLDKWKSLDKQRGTYLEGLTLKRASDGRIYTYFKEHGTESGRLSSSNPNLQNITRPKEGLPNIRRILIPDPGCCFVSGDLSQAELRTIAKLSGDEHFQSIYLDTNRSLHKEVATEFYGKGYTYEQYVIAKNINFGVVYWQSAYSFAQLYHMPVSEAQNFIDFWWERFPGVWTWTKSIEEKVLNEGELRSPFGHKRRFYVIPADQSGRLHIVKEGINFPPQNIAANATLYAICQIEKLVDPEIASIRLTVHDSITMNCIDEPKYVEETAYAMRSCMESALKEALDWDFPFLADVSVGPTYGDLTELEMER